MMGIQGAVENMGRSIVGNPQKAVLIIPTDTESVLNDEKIAARAWMALESASAIGTSEEAQAKKALQTAGFHILQVQYNPASLSISGNVSNMPVKSLQTNMDATLPSQNDRPPSIVLSVELFFDAVNNQDAFLFDKFRLSAGGFISDAAGAAKARQGGYSVMPQTNALVAAVLRKSTRDVIFKWADMTFGGAITELSARYTMFSVSGQPIRSVVQMYISQKVEGRANTSYWNNAFDKCFGSPESSQSRNAQDVGQYVSSLLNIGI